MSGIAEGTTAHTRAIVTKGEVIIGLSPTDALRGGDWLCQGLHLLLMLWLVFADHFVVGIIEDAVKGSGIVLSMCLSLSRCVDSFFGAEVV